MLAILAHDGVRVRRDEADQAAPRPDRVRAGVAGIVEAGLRVADDVHRGHVGRGVLVLVAEGSAATVQSASLAESDDFLHRAGLDVLEAARRLAQPERERFADNSPASRRARAPASGGSSPRCRRAGSPASRRCSRTGSADRSAPTSAPISSMRTGLVMRVTISALVLRIAAQRGVERRLRGRRRKMALGQRSHGGLAGKLLK